MQTTQRIKVDTFHRVLEFTASNRPTLADAPPGYAVQVKALQSAVDPIHGQSTLEAWNAIIPPRSRAEETAAMAAVADVFPSEDV